MRTWLEVSIATGAMLGAGVCLAVLFPKILGSTALANVASMAIAAAIVVTAQHPPLASSRADLAGERSEI